MPNAPEQSKINQAPLEVRYYIMELEKLAPDGVKFRNQISPEFKIGKVIKGDDGELDVQIKVITKRGNKPASNIPLKQLYVNGEPLINDSPEETNTNGVWAKLYHTEPVDFLKFELELEQNGETKKFSDVLTIQMPKEKRADKLLVISPEMVDEHTIGKTHDSVGSYIILQTLCEQEPVKAEVCMISDVDFQYSIEGVESKSAKKHVEEVDGALDLIILPSHGWQYITFSANGIKPQTFKFVTKT